MVMDRHGYRRIYFNPSLQRALERRKPISGPQWSIIISASNGIPAPSMDILTSVKTELVSSRHRYCYFSPFSLPFSLTLYCLKTGTLKIFDADVMWLTVLANGDYSNCISAHIKTETFSLVNQLTLFSHQYASVCSTHTRRGGAGRHRLCSFFSFVRTSGWLMTNELRSQSATRTGSSSSTRPTSKPRKEAARNKLLCQSPAASARPLLSLHLANDVNRNIVLHCIILSISRLSQPST